MRYLERRHARVHIDAFLPGIASLPACRRPWFLVEAARTGGALITAVKAAEYGIAVVAMPGDVDRASSEGCNLSPKQDWRHQRPG